MKEKGVILEIGCGESRAYENSTTIDIRRTQIVDVIADGKHLPFSNESFDLVYSSHTIEHFSHRVVELVLEEWVRVLKKEGTLELRCPDLRARCLLYAISPSRENLTDIYGTQDYPENFHESGFSFVTLRKILTDLGIVRIRRVMGGRKYIPLIPCDLHVRGVKRR